ncbi:hypothetical protein GIB67_033165 [Kingdonia uniflora]|uniref:Uncharacterized protein n=1 Tax=Kingdonia uniflora TaxID=39325 RepID=A0A7J7N3R4_9MAGN|nr:hypothetical protein GIB67_033165 [Kingdonia uniflora]
MTTAQIKEYKESCIENSWFKVLSVLDMMAIMLFSEANSLLVSKNLMDAIERNVSEDCKKDYIDLLLKVSGYLEFCVNHIVGRMPKEIKNTYDNAIFKKKKNKLNIVETVVFALAIQILVKSDVQRALTGGSALSELQCALQDYLPIVLGKTKKEHGLENTIEFKWKSLQDMRQQESCIENSWFKVLFVLHMMAILLFLEANSLLVRKILMDVSKRNVSEVPDYRKDSIDLLLKSSRDLLVDLNLINVLTRDYELCNHNMSEAFTFLGLACISQLAYDNLLNSKVSPHSSTPNCSLLMERVIDILIFQDYIICQEFLGISKFKHANTKCLFSMRNKLFKENLASEIVVMDGESWFITNSNLMYC